MKDRLLAAKHYAFALRPPHATQQAHCDAKRQQDTRVGGKTVGDAGLPSTTWCLRKASRMRQCGPILSNCRQQKIRFSLGVRRPHCGLEVNRHVTLIAHLIPYGARAGTIVCVRLQRWLQTMGIKPLHRTHMVKSVLRGDGAWCIGTCYRSVRTMSS